VKLEHNASIFNCIVFIFTKSRKFK